MPDLLVGFNEFERLAASILQDGRRLRFTAHGKSMHPFIQDGDILEVQNIAPDRMRRGDVVLCRLGDGRLVVHRIMRVNPDSFLIQGDALPFPDGAVSPTSVLGRVEALFRQGNHIRLDSFGMTFLVTIWLGFTPLRNRILRGIDWLRQR